MRSLFITYKAKPERAAENRALISDVFAELASVQPDKLRYLVFDFDDGRFVHYAVVPADPEANPLRKLAAFQRFSASNEERQLARPVVASPRIVGNYRTLLGVPDGHGND